MFEFKKRAKEVATGELYQIHHTNPQRGTITVCSLPDSAFNDGYDHTFYYVERHIADFEIVDVLGEIAEATWND